MSEKDVDNEKEEDEIEENMEETTETLSSKPDSDDTLSPEARVQQLQVGKTVLMYL